MRTVSTQALGVITAILWVEAVASAARSAPPQATELVSPLQAVGRSSDGLVTHLSLDATAYRQLEPFQDTVLTGFVLRDDRQVNLDLHRVHVLTPDAQIVEGTAGGDVPLNSPDVQIFGGRIVGEPDSLVFLSLSPHGNNGFIRLRDEAYMMSSNRAAGDTVIYELSSAAGDAINWEHFDCQSEGREVPGWDPDQLIPVEQSTALRGAAVSRSVSLAIETDWNFTNRFSGDTEASGAYALTLIAAISEIYERDVDAELRVDFLRLWTDSNDPWNQSSTGAQLDQFQAYWNANMTHVERHAAHFLTTRSLGGGIAYVGALCFTGWDYGLSANLNGTFPYPLQDNHFQNWDVMVVAHELGHNFGAPHTHSMVPKIDNCAGGDCSVVPNGTIMSYCHTCSGGMTNILLQFHTRIINERILPFLNGASCDFSAPAPEPPSAGAVRMNRYLSFNPDPANDGVDMAYRVELKSLQLGSCSVNGAPCRLDHGDADCTACSGSSEPCLAITDCAAGQTCDPTGEKCTNDQAGSVGMTWWVGPESPLGNGVGLLVSEPFRRVSDAWPSAVHVGDCEVVPRATYGIRAVEVATGLVSDEALVQTTLRPGVNYWADSVGPAADRCNGDPVGTICDPQANSCPGGEPCLETWSPPDGATNFDDITAGVFAFQASPGLPMADRMWVDLHGDGSGAAGSAAYDPPNYVANFADIQFTVLAFQGRPYPFSDPADCPDVGAWPE